MKEVKSPKKPLLFYYTIAILAVLVFNLFVSPWLLKSQINEVDYGTFMKMTEEKQIGKVEVEDSQILFTDKDEKNIYSTTPMEDPASHRDLPCAGTVYEQKAHGADGR